MNPTDLGRQRRRMLDDIESEVRYTSRMIGTTAFDPRVMQAMAEVPRHAFVPPSLVSRAYDNGPLPIGEGQTISQPYIVALMIDMLKPEPEHKVLEVGTGCGYQAAVLSRVVRQVYGIEIVETLGREAVERLRRLGYDNIEIRIGDGYAGWPEQAPFDGIIVAAAAPHIPPPLVEQLKPGGRMAIPVGSQWGGQVLMLVEKDEAGEVTTRDVLPVAFVPLTGGG